MSKMKIEVRKPQYAAAKQSAAETQVRVARKLPFFFQVLLLATYVCSGLALWYVFQRVKLLFF